jgi:hypothetical protein
MLARVRGDEATRHLLDNMEEKHVAGQASSFLDYSYTGVGGQGQ